MHRRRRAVFGIRKRLFQLASDRGEIHGGQVVPCEDSVDLGCVLCLDHDFRDAVRGVTVFQNTVEDAVLFCLLTKLLEILIFHGKNLQLLAAAKHGRKAGLALGTLLIFQNGVQENRHLLGAGTGDARSHLGSFQCDFYNLFSSII